jgi:hypothetical protein
MLASRWRELVWEEFGEVIPGNVTVIQAKRWQQLLDSIVSHAATPTTEAARNRPQEFSDNSGYHFSTSPATKDRYLPNIETIPDYIPLGLPPIVYVAYFHSFSTGNHTLLDSSTNEVENRAEGSKGRDKRIKRLLSKIVNHHSCTDSPLRNSSRLPVWRDEDFNGAKGDKRFGLVNCAALEDEAFCNAIALTKRQRRGKELGAWHRSNLPTSTVSQSIPSAISKRACQLETPPLSPHQDGDTNLPAHQDGVPDVSHAPHSLDLVDRSKWRKVVSTPLSDGHEHLSNPRGGSPGQTIVKPTKHHLAHVNECFGLTKRRHLSMTAEGPTVHSRHSPTPPNREAAMQGLGALATLLVNRGREARPLFPRLSDGELIDIFMRVFVLMQAVVLRSLVAGTLPRDKLKNQAVSQAIAALLLASMDQPAAYNIALVDNSCHPPTHPGLARDYQAGKALLHRGRDTRGRTVANHLRDRYDIESRSR